MIHLYLSLQVFTYSLLGLLSQASGSSVEEQLESIGSRIVEFQMNSNSMNLTMSDFCKEYTHSLSASIEESSSLLQVLSSTMAVIGPELMTKRMRKMSLQEKMDQIRSQIAAQELAKSELNSNLNARIAIINEIKDKIQEFRQKKPSLFKENSNSLDQLIKYFQDSSSYPREFDKSFQNTQLNSGLEELFTAVQTEYDFTTPEIIKLEFQQHFYDHSSMYSGLLKQDYEALKKSIQDLCATESNAYIQNMRARRTKAETVEKIKQIFVDMNADIGEYSRNQLTADLLN